MLETGTTTDPEKTVLADDDSMDPYVVEPDESDVELSEESPNSSDNKLKCPVCPKMCADNIEFEDHLCQHISRVVGS